MGRIIRPPAIVEASLQENPGNILEMRSISKHFPGVQAVKSVDFSVPKGTVHALIGENGAGKSTLMKILIGLYQRDGGSIRFDGEDVSISSVRHAIKLGISMIFQELSPIPHMTVAENLFLNREPMRKGRVIIDRARMAEATRELLGQLKVRNMAPDLRMSALSVSQTQMVEIAKAISYRSKLVIMDEPTSAITGSEVDHLFEVVTELKRRGLTFIFITHKIDEIFKIADGATIMRDGSVVATREVSELTPNALVEMMVGREISQFFPKEEAIIGEVVLKVESLSRGKACKSVSFDLRRGEILGFAGLIGSGRSEVMETLFGYRPAEGGTISIKGKAVKIRNTSDAIRHGLAFITEDRKNTGLILPLSVVDNMIVADLNHFSKGIFLERKKIRKECQEAVDRLSIKTPSLTQIVRNLSGGNQQKVVISKWLFTESEIIILDEPTRGIDVGAKAEIHRIMSHLAKLGKAIIMISSELPEILGMSDRIVVMREGRVAGVVDRKDATQQAIIEYATGLR